MRRLLYYSFNTAHSFSRRPSSLRENLYKSTIMLSATELERLIAMKRREIDQEKIHLGLSPLPDTKIAPNDQCHSMKNGKTVKFDRPRAYSETDTSIFNNNLHKCEDTLKNKENNNADEQNNWDNSIPPDLERYIRRYLGLPVMLKAGEFSPNNPLIRAERSTGDVLLGLGEYERRRNTLRKIRQKQYREYLDEQAKKKQEAKEKAERERREREEKERLEEARERQRLDIEREPSPEGRRASYTCMTGSGSSYPTKVDTGVQVDYRSAPLSVAVQTDGELYTPNPRITNLLTQAERELSPHVVPRDRLTQPGWAQGGWQDAWPEWGKERRRSYGDFERPTTEIRPCPRDKLHTVPRYQPSILDADAIQLRNERAEKEAAERRQFYQRELQNQILEQQRLREERTCREKMLEAAEMRRLEQQLRSLQLAHEHEAGRQRHITDDMKRSGYEYEKKKNILQDEIDAEKRALLKSRHTKDITAPSYYSNDHRPPYSTNIPETSIFSTKYDVDTYLRRNLNPSKESLISNPFENKLETRISERKFATEKTTEDRFQDDNILRDARENRALGPEIPTERSSKYNLPLEENARLIERSRNEISDPQSSEYDQPKSLKENSLRNKESEHLTNRKCDDFPLPVLRHSPKSFTNDEHNSNLSEAMQMVDDKWRVPAVQRNILKSLPKEGGKNVSILTQLGSIRRQLQMEQLKLDKMLLKNN